ncbi:hypothetical protein NYQ31_11825 [Curtobacterium flaccumfaciens]|uniref:hypothetical protein n=1 Tax=Curtobacterium flaccumfaciens TaxID=2035 RepID=UPI00217ECAEA|nr:hypothetical protein [Curtobacterium flaccumfaciens]MCS6559088.1 hypothetical protein [Curtobacterium flaccumfaciens]
MPMSWRDYVDDAAASSLVFEQWLSTLAPWARVPLIARIDDLTGAAARGEIVWNPDAENDPNAPLVPIRADPDLYELRWKLLSKQVRQYHAEPADPDDILVSLVLHIKTGKHNQDAEIENAVERYERGAASEWN